MALKELYLNTEFLTGRLVSLTNKWSGLLCSFALGLFSYKSHGDPKYLGGDGKWTIMKTII